MTDTDKPPIEEASEHLAEVAEETAAAVEEAVETAHEAVAEPVADASETAQEAATEAAEAVEEAVEAAVESAPHLSSDHADEVYNRVLGRLREEGHIGSPAIAEEIAGETEHVAEVAVEAPEVVAEETATRVRDTIAPISEHPWYRPRKIFGRTI